MIDPLDRWLCGAAQSAYSTPATFVAGGDVHAVVTEHDGAVAVAFRGTVPEDWEDWFRDAAAWPRRDHPALGPCHDGFLSGAETIMPQLLSVLTASKPFALTGHSLGGALAIAAGALLTDGGLPPTRLTTFGAPRVGMRLGQLLAPIDGLRVRHGNDPVPEVPCWPYVSDRAWTQIGAPALNPIDDHLIAGYVDAVSVFR